jgi:hypothetical protein
MDTPCDAAAYRRLHWNIYSEAAGDTRVADYPGRSPSRGSKGKILIPNRIALKILLNFPCLKASDGVAYGQKHVYNH